MPDRTPNRKLNRLSRKETDLMKALLQSPPKFLSVEQIAVANVIKRSRILIRRSMNALATTEQLSQTSDANLIRSFDLLARFDLKPSHG